MTVACIRMVATEVEKPACLPCKAACRHFMRNFRRLFSCTFPKDIYNHPKVFSTENGKISNFPWWLSGKELAYSLGNTRDMGSVPGLGRSFGEGHGNPLQYSCLENSHGQRSLVGYSLWAHRISHDLAEHAISPRSAFSMSPRELIYHGALWRLSLCKV